MDVEDAMKEARRAEEIVQEKQLKLEEIIYTHKSLGLEELHMNRMSIQKNIKDVEDQLAFQHSDYDLFKEQIAYIQKQHSLNMNRAQQDEQIRRSRIDTLSLKADNLHKDLIAYDKKHEQKQQTLFQHTPTLPSTTTSQKSSISSSTTTSSTTSTAPTKALAVTEQTKATMDPKKGLAATAPAKDTAIASTTNTAASAPTTPTTASAPTTPTKKTAASAPASKTATFPAVSPQLPTPPWKSERNRGKHVCPFHVYCIDKHTCKLVHDDIDRYTWLKGDAHTPPIYPETWTESLSRGWLAHMKRIESEGHRERKIHVPPPTAEQLAEYQERIQQQEERKIRRKILEKNQEEK